MKADTKLSFSFSFAIAASLFGSLTALLITFFPPTTVDEFLWRKPLIGLIFTVICVGGSVASISPAKCSVSLNTHVRGSTSSENLKRRLSIASKGHHPDCGRFSAHTIRFRDTSYCAACTGLISGVAIALASAIPYFFFGVDFTEIGIPAILIGELGLALGFVQFKFKGWVRAIANSVFVVGSSSMLIGIDERMTSLFVDLYLIGLIVLWILTRIMISQWDHARTCSICGFLCKKERKVDVSVPPTQSV